MLTHTSYVRVRYGETDQMGYVYYGQYAAYYEVGRVELLRHLGMSYRDMEEQGIMMPVVAMNVRYVRPARYDDLLCISTSVRRLPEADISFHVDIHNEAGELLNGASVRLCFVDAASREVLPPPPFILEKMRPYFAKPAE